MFYCDACACYAEEPYCRQLGVVVNFLIDWEFVFMYIANFFNPTDSKFRWFAYFSFGY